MQISPDELKSAGLIVRGRMDRGRTYEVKQPKERLNSILQKIQSSPLVDRQDKLFENMGAGVEDGVPLVDLLHLFIGLSAAGESVVPHLERFADRRLQLMAALRFARDEREDWAKDISRILPLVEGTPLLNQMAAPDASVRPAALPPSGRSEKR